MNIDNTVFSSFYRYWSKASRTAFVSAVIAGFLVHMYAFTNIIPNSDGLSRVYDYQQMTIAGRFFLQYASMLHGYIQAPMLIGILSTLLLASSAMFVIDLLDVRGTVSAAIIGLLMVTFPAVTYTYMFIFTASAYGVGILFAVVSVWICRKKIGGRGSIIISIVLLCLSVGIYQSYFAVAIALSLLCVLKDLFDQQYSDSKVFQRGMYLLVYLFVGIVLYYIVLQIVLKVKDLSLFSYRGIDGFTGSMSITWILRSVLGAYKDFLKYFFKPGFMSYNTGIMILVNIVITLFILAAILLMIIGKKRMFNSRRILLLLLIGVLVPLGFDFSNVLSSSTPIMRYSLVFVYISAFVLLDWLWKEYTSDTFISLLGNSSIVVGALAVLLFAQVANIAYTASQTAHRATEAFAANMVSRVENLEGYSSDMEVVVIGGFPTDTYYNSVEGFETAVHNSSCLPDTVLLKTKHVYYYLNDWLNVQWKSPEESEFIEVSDSAEFQAMPLYPDDGSVQIVNGRVYVKLAEEYTPLKDYEIVYENRR